MSAVRGGVLVGIYGLWALPAGLYRLIGTPRGTRVEQVEPERLSLELGAPGQRGPQAQLIPRQPGAFFRALPQEQRLHFSAKSGRWSAPQLPRSLALLQPPISAGWESSPGGLGERAAEQPSDSARRSAQSPAPLPTPPHRPPSAGELVLSQELREQGEACYRRRDYRCALQRFERAFALAPTSAMRFNLASALDKLGQRAAAARQYRRYLHEAGSVASPSALTHIQRRLPALEAQLGRLLLTVHPAAATVTLDELPAAALGEQLPGGGYELIVEPGPHQLEVSHPDFPRRQVALRLGAGESRALALDLAAQGSPRTP